MAKSRKLVLHFDVHKTVIVADSGAKYGPEQALNAFLTDVVWGKEEIIDTDGNDNGVVDNVEGTNSRISSLSHTSSTKWVWHSYTPSMAPPRKDSMNYYKYLEEKLVTQSGDRSDLRAAVSRFTHTEQGRHFKQMFNMLAEQLSWKHQSADHDDFTIRGEGRRSYHFIFPSFLKLFYSLQEQGREFSVILRTFGQDASKVLNCLQRVFRGQHPDFEGKTLPLHVNCKPGKVRRFKPNSSQRGIKLCFSMVPRVSEMIETNDNWGITSIQGKGKFVPGQLGSKSDEHSDKIVSSDSEIYRHLSNMTGVCALVDDYQFWRNGAYCHLAAKPLWIDLTDRSTHHIFFDDNIRPSSFENIVDVRLLNGETGDARSLNLSELQTFHGACLVQTDLLDSIGNADYFINKIELCERNYDILLEQEPLKL